MESNILQHVTDTLLHECNCSKCEVLICVPFFIYNAKNRTNLFNLISCVRDYNVPCTLSGINEKSSQQDLLMHIVEACLRTIDKLVVTHKFSLVRWTTPINCTKELYLHRFQSSNLKVEVKTETRQETFTAIMQFVEVNTYWIQISNVNVRYNLNNMLAHLS